MSSEELRAEVKRGLAQLDSGESFSEEEVFSHLKLELLRAEADLDVGKGIPAEEVFQELRKRAAAKSEKPNSDPNS